VKWDDLLDAIVWWLRCCGLGVLLSVFGGDV
jgi:hypothetical protein